MADIATYNVCEKHRLGRGYGDHCPDCNACDYDNGDCKNIFCLADLID